MYECNVQARQLEKCFGKYPGLVKDNTAPDDQAHLGELLVEVPGILEEGPNGQGPQPIQVWAKPCFAPGFFFIPEVDAQVWVEFIAGDINQPLWTGVWYPTKAVPQTVEGKDPKRFQKIIRTVSGHVIQLDDSEGKEKIIILDKHGNQVTLDSQGVTIKSNKAIKLGSDGAAEPLVLGHKWFELFNKHTHIGNMGAPTSPPAGSGTQATGIELSDKHFTEK